MPLPSTVSNGVKAYNLSAAKISPKWETAKSEKNRVEEPDRENSIELLQDFSFPSSTTLIRISEDNGHLVTAGTYKPQIKAFELSQLSLKFERHLEEETVDFRILSEDYSKLCFLRRDRFLEFHTQFGSHYKTKLPQNGRNMIFNRFNCDLLIASSRKEVYRLNLEEGRFKKSITTDLELNHGALHDKLRFYAFGGEDHVACFDERSNGEIASFEVQKSLENGSETVNGIRRIAFDKSGASNDLLMAVGTGSGRTLVYDIRMKKPLFAKDHRNERPIVDLSFHSSDKFVSADQNGIKFWDCKTVFATNFGILVIAEFIKILVDKDLNLSLKYISSFVGMSTLHF
ncbi:hypothetical protein MHBO_001036 [Bonamia ostreae]|uniref:Nucleolar protein 10-like N-terminal domain-containing protein n=1 Tax=Bonamia ostreae TaxID=126728 RepID=A0ABV2AHM3_9EUKA